MTQENNLTIMNLYETIHAREPDVLKLTVDEYIDIIVDVAYLHSDEEDESEYPLCQHDFAQVYISLIDGQHCLTIRNDAPKNDTQKHQTLLFEKFFDTFRELVEFFFKEFKSNYVYSRLTNAYIHKSLVIKTEQVCAAKILLNNKNLEEFRCSVCLQPNSIRIDGCLHNLCRICCYKMPIKSKKKRQCPVCDVAFDELIPTIEFIMNDDY